MSGEAADRINADTAAKTDPAEYPQIPDSARMEVLIEAMTPPGPVYLQELEQKAVSAGIPVIRPQTQNLIRFFLSMSRPARILEIGTAVGFSALFMQYYGPAGCRITTIEKDPERAAAARENFIKYGGCGKNGKTCKSEENGKTVKTGENGKTVKTVENGKTVKAGENSKTVKAGENSKTVKAGENSKICKAEENDKAEENGKVCETVRDGRPGEDSIVLLEGDAAQVLGEIREDESFDLIFMDAAKGQYIRFLPDALRLLRCGGIMITDNILQEGEVLSSRFAVTRRNRTIHARMRAYIRALMEEPQLETLLLSTGDGAAVSCKKHPYCGDCKQQKTSMVKTRRLRTAENNKNH